MTSATTMRATGSGVRPGADWAGWLGYAPTARGPEARRARAEAAGLIAPMTLEAEPAAEVATPAPAAPRAPRRRRAVTPALRRRRPCAANDAESLIAAGRR